VDTKKVGGDGGRRCWNSLLGGERSSNPLAHKISITLHRQGGKREPRSPRGNLCILGRGGAWGWRLRPRPSKGLPKATIGHNMASTWPNKASTRPQHGLNTATTCKTANWLFCSKFLSEAPKKIELYV
jgi:hypothetical protein